MWLGIWFFTIYYSASNLSFDFIFQRQGIDEFFPQFKEVLILYNLLKTTTVILWW